MNQQVELTALVSGGTPPYTYQWYTIFVPQDLLDKGPRMLLDGRVVKVEVPGANSSKFNFTESTPGTYEVNLRIIDRFDALSFYVYPLLKQIRPASNYISPFKV